MEKALAVAKHNVERYNTAVGVTENLFSFVEMLEFIHPTFFTGAVRLYKELGIVCIFIIINSTLMLLPFNYQK